MIRVLILDDHRIFAEALCSMFEDETDIEVVAATHTSQDALSVLESKPVDVAVMDIRLKDSEMSGIELAEHLYEHHPTVKVILLTVSQEGRTIARALQHNVSGYMIKHSAGAALRQAIQQVTTGDTFYSPEVMKAHMDYVRHQQSMQVKLTKRERQVLQLLVDEFSTSEIGHQLSIGDSGVETHRRNLRNKLKVKNTAGLIREAILRNLIDLDKYR